MSLPFDAPPAFFRRVWIAPMEGPLTIYGRHSPSPFAEDKPREAEAWERRGAFAAECFSVVEPGGEYGMVAVTSGVVPITEREFEAARSRGWLP